MKVFFPVAAAMAAVLFATAASAQLKPGAGTGLGAPSRPAPPAITAPSAAETAPQVGSNASREAEGKLAAAGWLVLLDRRDWGRAWETSAGIFRANVPLGSWMDNIPKVRDPLGPFVERTAGESVYKTTLEGRPDGEYVSVVFDSKFGKKETQEIVTTVRDPDGKWRVTGYSIR